MTAARHFSQLTVWKLADEIRSEAFQLTARPRFAADLRARSQAEDAANSACRNIAEGFGADTHAEFARFLVIARRSLNELEDILRGAREKKYLNDADLAPVRRLFKRVHPALGRLIGYLRRTPTPRETARHGRGPGLMPESIESTRPTPPKGSSYRQRASSRSDEE